jgi:3-deoxy-7-phosphoheptulonate synthase
VETIMIIVTRPGITAGELDRLRERIEALGLRTHVSRGEHRTIIGCIGDEERLREVPLSAMPGVEQVLPVLKPYKLAAREFAATPTRVRVGRAEFGGDALLVAAGPCSVEGREMLHATALAVRDAGATLLRAGAFKPRTSPYAFRGLGEAALEAIAEVRRESGLPVVTEVLDTRQVEIVAEHADMLQIGARNMQNFALLTEVGKVQRPVLLKRGPAATIADLLLAAEYVMSQGNMQVVLCERGIRSFDSATRNTFDIAAIPVLKRETHLPVIADPSHAAGRRALVPALAFAAVAAGADGLMIEVHPDPEKALSDGDQSLSFREFRATMQTVREFARVAGRSFDAGVEAGAVKDSGDVAVHDAEARLVG